MLLLNELFTWKIHSHNFVLFFLFCFIFFLHKISLLIYDYFFLFLFFYIDMFLIMQAHFFVCCLQALNILSSVLEVYLFESLLRTFLPLHSLQGRSGQLNHASLLPTDRFINRNKDIRAFKKIT